MSEPASLVATVRGKVQGVSFRAFTAYQARALRLTGYVVNLPDGNSVEVKAEGEKANLDRLLEHLKVGPPGAQVRSVETWWGKHTGLFAAFEIRRR